MARMNTDNTHPLIIHVIRRLDYGGMESVLIDLINAMGDEPFRHAVICLAGYTEFRARLRSTKVPVYNLGKREGKDFLSYWRLWRLFRQLRPSIVNTYNIATLDAAPIARFAGSYVVHAEHGWSAGKDSVPFKYLLLRRLMSPFIDRVVAVSEDLSSWLRDNVHLPESRIVCIHNGVDSSIFSACDQSRAEARHYLGIPAEAFVVGTVARLDPVKAQGQLIQAITMLDDSSVRASHLYIVGEGNERARLEALICDLDAGHLVTLTGTQNDVPKWLAAFDVFALPSLNEGISIAALEAMASGRPVVATDVGGNSEVVMDGKTGQLVPVGDMRALAQALARYRDDPPLADVHGEAGRQRMHNEFSLEMMVKRYIQLYVSLLGSFSGFDIKDAA